MNVFILDTNVLLRFFLKDHPEQVRKARSLFERAEQGDVRVVVVSQVIVECEYVLRKVYGYDAEKIGPVLSDIARQSYFDVVEREQMIQALTWYQQTRVDLIDCLLFAYAVREGAEVFSFDKDFEKLKKIAS